MDDLTEKDVFGRHLTEKCDFLRKEKNLKKNFFFKKKFFFVKIFMKKS